MTLLFVLVLPTGLFVSAITLFLASVLTPVVIVTWLRFSNMASSSLALSVTRRLVAFT